MIGVGLEFLSWQTSVLADRNHEWDSNRSAAQMWADIYDNDNFIPWFITYQWIIFLIQIYYIHTVHPSSVYNPKMKLLGAKHQYEILLYDSLYLFVHNISFVFQSSIFLHFSLHLKQHF